MKYSIMQQIIIMILKAPAKNAFKMLSAQLVCCIYSLTLLTNVSIEANSVDPDMESWMTYIFLNIGYYGIKVLTLIKF